MARPRAHLTAQAASSSTKGDSPFLPLATKNQPKSVNDLINNLIHEIEISQLYGNAVGRKSYESHDSTFGAPPSLRVKHLVSATEHPQSASSLDQCSSQHLTTDNRDKRHVPRIPAYDPVSSPVVKTSKAQTAPFRSNSTRTHRSRPALRIETKQAYAGFGNIYEPESPPLNAGYRDPRSQNAVRRYRASSAVTEPISAFARVHGSQTGTSSLPSSKSQENVPVDRTTRIIKDTQSEPQPSSIKTKSWISGRLAASRPSDKVSSFGLVKQKEKASRDVVRPISPAKAKNFMKRLGRHSTPQFSANDQREEQLRRAIREKALLAKKLSFQEIAPETFSAETSPKEKGQAAMPTPPVNMDYGTQDECGEATPLVTPFPLTYQTKVGQKIVVQPKSLSSIRRSASKKSATGSVYNWRDNTEAQMSTLLPPDQLQNNNVKRYPGSSVQESLNCGGQDCNVPHYSPVDAKNLEYIDIWVKTPIPKARPSSPAEPTTPVFSSESDNSTAASSPVGSSKGELSAELEGSCFQAPLSYNASMTASITCWKDLDGCTPQFLHSLGSLRETGRSQSPELDSPTSVYSVQKIPIEFQDSAPEVVSQSMDQLVEESTQERPLTTFLAPFGPESIAGQQSRSVQTKNLKGENARRSRPHVAQLSIPLRQSSTVTLVMSVDNSLLRFPHAKSRTRMDSRSIRKSCSSMDFKTHVRLQKGALGEYARSGSAPSSPIEEEEFISALTPSILVNALKKQHSYRTQMQERAPPEEERTIKLQGSNQISIPKRVSRPLDVWDAPGLYAPKGGLQLRVSRKHLTGTKLEWVIASAISSRPLLRCIDQSDSPSQKRDFWDPEGKHLFGFQKTVGSTRVAESDDGKALFVVRNASLSLMPHWTVTHKWNSEESSAQWIATGDDDFRNVVVLWGGFMVGRISVESDKLRHNYIVTIKSNMNYCLMAALVTVFDDLRVDEGYF